jgi:hypothetical protein
MQLEVGFYRTVNAFSGYVGKSLFFFQEVFLIFEGKGRKLFPESAIVFSSCKFADFIVKPTYFDGFSTAKLWNIWLDVY